MIEKTRLQNAVAVILDDALSGLELIRCRLTKDRLMVFEPLLLIESTEVRPTSSHSITNDRLALDASPNDQLITLGRWECGLSSNLLHAGIFDQETRLEN